MYYLRTWKNGVDHDPRQRTFVEYHCDACNKNHDVDITGNFKYDKTRIRKCPHCRAFGKDDKKQSLKLELEELTEQRSVIEIKIEKLISELEVIHA